MSWFGKRKARTDKFRSLGLSKKAAKKAAKTAKQNGKKTS